MFGPGRCIYANGEYYEGMWQGGMHHGLGRIIKNDQIVKMGLFNSDYDAK